MGGFEGVTDNVVSFAEARAASGRPPATPRVVAPSVDEAGSPELLHYVTQDGQPYGSVRRCCESCGRMCWSGMKGSARRWTSDFARWNAASDSCGRDKAR